MIYASDVIVSSTGNIQSNGSSGGASEVGAAGAGGGSGGGSVNIFYSNSYVNDGVLMASGGNGGISRAYCSASPYRCGGWGGNGTVRYIKYE
jgi:hypothetical protein